MNVNRCIAWRDWISERETVKRYALRGFRSFCFRILCFQINEIFNSFLISSRLSIYWGTTIEHPTKHNEKFNKRTSNKIHCGWNFWFHFYTWKLTSLWSIRFYVEWSQRRSCASYFRVSNLLTLLSVPVGAKISWFWLSSYKSLLYFVYIFLSIFHSSLHRLVSISVTLDIFGSKRMIGDSGWINISIIVKSDHLWAHSKILCTAEKCRPF